MKNEPANDQSPFNPYQSPTTANVHHGDFLLAGGHPPAGFWIRVAAQIVDGLVLSSLICGGMLPFAAISPELGTLVVLAVVLLYKPLMEGTKGATLGKMALSVRIVDKRGRPIHLGQAFMRSLPAFLSVGIQLMVGLGIGFGVITHFRGDSLQFVQWTIQVCVLIDGIVVMPRNHLCFAGRRR